MSDESAIKRAASAYRLLSDDLMLEARTHMRESLTRAMWRRHELAESDQQKLDAYVRHYGDFFAWFERVLADGKLAEADLKEKGRVAQMRERIRRI